MSTLSLHTRVHPHISMRKYKLYCEVNRIVIKTER